jgi:nucleotide-binding universal stress UspA family protein
MFNHILVATDASPAADKAVATALRMANGSAKVTALMVVPDYTTGEFAELAFKSSQSFETLRRSLAKEGRRRLDAELDRHGEAARDIDRRVAVNDQAYAEILEQAEQLKCDVIVMGSRGRGPLKAALLGSQTAAVIAGASVPVVVVK